jgi:chaperonin cofactor prefoldin
MEWVWFIVAIVAITQIGELAKKWLTLKAKNERSDPDKDARIEALENRVATLERIATDDKSQLKRTIDAL